jgi:hypothetical protein
LPGGKTGDGTDGNPKVGFHCVPRR